MKNLIIHPQDTSTDFLSPIYTPLKNKTVVKGGITKTELRTLIESHDRIIMLGHGSPYGKIGHIDHPSPFLIDHPSPDGKTTP